MKRALLALLLTMPAHGVELSLEENRAERGNIGFLDMKKLFTLFPETARAKEVFEESVRQAEEQVNLRKNELLRLRAELAQMKADREVLAAAPQQPIAETPPPPAPKAQQAPQPVQPVQPAASDADQTAPAQPAVSTTVASLPGLTINLPGATTAPVVVQDPEGQTFQGESGSPVTPIETPPAPPAQPEPAAVAVSTPAAAPSQTPLELLDARIAEREAEIRRKEGEYKEHRTAAEKNLLDLESRRSEQLLGKIYRAVQEVARKEGVSVVVDKSAILYGHGAVDLTDKVLKQLKGT